MIKGSSPFSYVYNLLLKYKLNKNIIIINKKYKLFNVKLYS